MFINTESNCSAPVIAVLQNRGGINEGISFSKSTNQINLFLKNQEKNTSPPCPTTKKTKEEKQDLKQSRF